MSHLYVPDDSGEYMDGIREATVPEVLAWLQEQNVGEEVEWCKFHSAQGTSLGFCFIGAAPYSEAYKDCQIELRLVIPLDTEPPKESE